MSWNDCPVCGRPDCENPRHRPPAVDERTMSPAPMLGLDPDAIDDVSTVVAEGQQLEANGIPYLVDGLVPGFGMLGMLVAKAKVGKTTFAMQLGAAVAQGLPFLDRMTKQAKVLIIAAEDPPEYTAWLARHLGEVPRGTMAFYRRPVRLDTPGLDAIAHTLTTGHYGLVLIASWQAVIVGLLDHENNNAGAVAIAERVKQVARLTNVPWLIDAHAGKGEDQGDDADPTLAMRGASAAAAAADYTLSLRYADSPFSTKRRISGKGRFVNFAPLLIDCEADQGTYTVVGGSKTILKESTWQLVITTGALTPMPQTAWSLASAIGLVSPKTGKPTTSHIRQVQDALRGREGVRTVTELHKGKTRALFSRMAEPGENAINTTTEAWS